MRTALRNKLISDYPTLGVYQVTAVTAETEKPYIVLTKSDEVETNIKNGFDTYYSVYAYISMGGDVTQLDNLVDNVISSLHNSQLITDGFVNFTPEYKGFLGNEFIEEDWGVVGQGLQFKINNLIL